MNAEINKPGIVKTKIQRSDHGIHEQLGKFGVATIHEATGKMGLLKPYMRPICPGLKVYGSALTVLLQPGDNWMMHVAAEQIKPGDVVIATCTSYCEDGFFGELLATSFHAQGAMGLIIDGGVRDVSELIDMRFPVFSRAICAQGTYKLNLGSVNVPIVCAGTVVYPGDCVVGDDDGVVVVPQSLATQAIDACSAREEAEAIKRQRLASGELGLDISGMREKLMQAGLKYVD